MTLNVLVHSFEALVGCGALLVIYMLLEAKQSNIVELHQTLPGLSPRFEGFSLYFLSDIHRRRLSPRMLEHLSKVDLVIIGGDLIEYGAPFERMEWNLSRLKELGAPMIFVWGNHDLQVDPYRFRSILKANHVQILTNRERRLNRGDHALTIIGVHDATNHLDCLDLALLNVKNGGPRILVSHNPEMVDRIKPHHGISLVISGHTHGGQIRVFGWGIREKGGVKKMPFGTLIISNGYGTTRYPLRLGAPPNTILLNLHSSLGE